jgi:hypothetical protein
MRALSSADSLAVPEGYFLEDLDQLEGKYMLGGTTGAGTTGGIDGGAAASHQRAGSVRKHNLIYEVHIWALGKSIVI